MGQVLHGSAKITHAIRAAIQRSQASVSELCDEFDIEHRLTKINHPWTNGQVERMNRTLKEATVKRYHYENHDQLRSHLETFVAAYNFAKRLKTLQGLTPYEYVCKIWTKEPERFKIDQTHHTLGLNTQLIALQN